MKIIHTSDIHLGAALSSKFSNDKMNERRAELFETFRRMTDEAKRISAAAFIISGDMFDSDCLSYNQCMKIVDIINRCPSILFFYLVGNHEKNAFLECGIDLPENLKTFGEDWTYYGFSDVKIAGRTKIEPQMFDTLRLNELDKNIVLLHGALVEGKTSNDNIGIADAKNKCIDYLALGHYHSYGTRKIDERGTAVYSGSPEGRGFDEVGQKGFVLIDTDEKGIKHSFIPFASRTVRWIKVDISGITTQSQIFSKAENALSDIPNCDIVRLSLVGEIFPEFIIDTEDIKARYKDRFYYFELIEQTSVKLEQADYKNDKSLKGEFIRLVMSKSDISEIDKERIIRCGISALFGQAPKM